MSENRHRLPKKVSEIIFNHIERTSKTIFFDFDGVIADSLSIAFEVNKLSKPTLTLKRYKAYFNDNINDARHEDKVVHKVDFFLEYGKRFETLGIDEQKQRVIKKFARKFRLFIISSTTTNIIRQYLRRHKILDCFIDILGNEVHASKIKKFRLLFRKYNVDPKDVIFITDSVGDMKEAKKARINGIVGILGGYQEKETLEKGKPAVIVRDFLQLREFISDQL